MGGGQHFRHGAAAQSEGPGVNIASNLILEHAPLPTICIAGGTLFANCPLLPEKMGSAFPPLGGIANLSYFFVIKLTESKERFVGLPRPSGGSVHWEIPADAEIHARYQEEMKEALRDSRATWIGVVLRSNVLGGDTTYVWRQFDKSCENLLVSKIVNMIKEQEAGL